MVEEIRNTRILSYVFGIVFGIYGGASVCSTDICQPIFLEVEETDSMEKNMEKNDRTVIKKQLANGMTVLLCPTHTIPSVSLQIWYNVGSKHENTGEKGIAHLIEHMIFKGTTGKNSLQLSESDINVVSQALSATCNAFTAQDFTGYLFNVPTQNWKQVLPIMADCMLNAAFKDDHINSEMKAVIQELKMRRDNYILSLAEAMLSAIFIDHPYHYPIIGFKQDLWNIHSKNLHEFYKKHYMPNNATLVVVGDIDPTDAFEEIKKCFGGIKTGKRDEKGIFFHTQDIISKGITLYRDVAQPTVLTAFVIPGLVSKNKPIIDIASWILGKGKGSRLYKKIVDELHLATSLSTFHWDILFEHSVFFIAFEPSSIQDIQTTISIINQEIHDIVEHGLPEQELERAVKKARMEYYALLEDNEKQANELGKYFLATGDEHFVFNYLQEDNSVLAEKVCELFKDYFRPSVMHLGKVLPLSDQEKETWAAIQHESDQEDVRFLSARERTTPIEHPSYAHAVTAHKPMAFDFPKPTKTQLSNGLKVLYYHNPTTPKINIELRFKAKDFYDPQELQGLYSCVATMMTEGTTHYTAAQLAHELESRGMALHVYPGGISMSMLSSDFAKGLELLLGVLTQATFDEKELKKVKEQMLAELKNFWDDPATFSGQLIKQRIYCGHPYAQNSLGTEDAIKAITPKNLKDFYAQYITPHETTLAVVGDLQDYNVHKELEAVLGKWHGKQIADKQFPVLSEPKATTIEYPINRDQVVLCFAAPSVTRKDKDYDKLLLFDQILAGGVLGSMNSRLFKLREHTGLFYSIGGSLTAQANEQPGMILVKTKVSLDRLAEAEKAIKDTLAHVADDITPQELSQAKNAIINALKNAFESNANIAQAFLYADRYNLPDTFYDTRAQQLEHITKEQVQEAVKRVLKVDQLATFKIGRIGAVVA